MALSDCLMTLDGRAASRSTAAAFSVGLICRRSGRMLVVHHRPREVIE